MGDGERDRRETAGITRSAARVGAATMISRVFGLARDTAFAVLFGTGFVADAFNLAFLVPNVFRRLVGEGNINPSFIPVFTEIRERRGPEEAGRFLKRVAGVLLAGVTALVILGMLFAGPVVHLYARDWKSNPGDFDLAVGLLRLLFPYLLFAGGAALASAALNARRHFAVPALAPVLLNVFFLLGAAAALTYDTLPERITAFAWGGLAGGLAAWMVQIPKMRAMGLPAGLEWRPADPDVRRVGALMVPGVIALGVTQMNLFVDTLLALRLEEGSLTALRLGNRVMLLPLGVIGVAVSTAALPTLSQRAAEQDRNALLETLAHTLRLLNTLLLPAAVGLVILAGPIVALLFQYGEFTADRSTPMTAAALLYYSLGLPAYGLVKGLAQGFYSVQDTRTPVKIAAVAMVANIALNLLLMGPLGLRGLALATSLSAWLNVALLARVFTARVGPLPPGAVMRSAARTLAAGAALGAGCLAGLRIAALVTGPELIARPAPVVLGMVLGLAGMLAAFRLLRHDEMDEILSSLPLPGRRR
ncbi:MAG TPA: murein biosynthesis integral membrane protein MurJ [bacterium]|nr:murein biosynthesis integral membrane protein MurJ [bacterium]